MQKLSEVLYTCVTKENIALVISVIGLLISLLNAAYFFAIRRKILIVNFGQFGIKNHGRNKLFMIHYRFDNASQLSLAITRVQLIIDNTHYDCDHRKHLAEEIEYRKKQKVIYEYASNTDILPINLAPLSSQSGFLGFVIPPDSLSKDEKVLTFRICTNRGKVVQRTFALYEDVLIR